LIIAFYTEELTKRRHTVFLQQVCSTVTIEVIAV